MRLNPKKTRSRAVSRSRTIAAGYADLTLGSGKIGEAKSLCILEVALVTKLTFEFHLRNVVSKVARSLGVVFYPCFIQLGVLCPRVDVIGGVSFGFAG